MIIAQGAEAIISRNGSIVSKVRPVKKYRLPEIDSVLRKQRTRREATILSKVNVLGISAPKLISFSDKTMTVELEFLSGKKVRDVFTPLLAREIGMIVGQLHSNDIIHGDLTTSNFILHDGKVHVIDFGLSLVSSKTEDKAVDLHLLSQALESKHHEIHALCWKEVIIGYKETNKDWKLVLERLVTVESRGRNKK
ncbi:Kae1-associated serine/threonine protein kinase [Candidatus Woesearchaeota archaeon]|nr:Kae1-associated serine/threonine protein kinase [Candidatus Woesearchaeota archaeon]